MQKRPTVGSRKSSPGAVSRSVALPTPQMRTQRVTGDKATQARSERAPKPSHLTSEPKHLTMPSHTLGVMKGPARGLAVQTPLGDDDTSRSRAFPTTRPSPPGTAEHPLPQAQGGALSPTVRTRGQAPERGVRLTGTRKAIGGPAPKRSLAIPCTGVAPHE